MGCCQSKLQEIIFRLRGDCPNIEDHFPNVIQICERSDSSSDSGLKTKGEKRDTSPLLEGPTLMAFKSLNLSSTSSSSDDAEVERIGALLTPAGTDGTKTGGTFKKVDEKPISSSSDMEIE